MTSSISGLVTQLGQILTPRGERIALAESCTGGLMASALVADPAAGGVLQRALIVYSTEAKCDLLGLDRGKVEACDGVSEHIAREMAHSLLDRSEADLALATTGFAGPQEEEEEVGLVHIALATSSGIWHVEKHFGDQGRNRVRELATAAALELAIEHV